MRVFEILVFNDDKLGTWMNGHEWVLYPFITQSGYYARIVLIKSFQDTVLIKSSLAAKMQVYFVVIKS